MTLRGIIFHPPQTEWRYPLDTPLNVCQYIRTPEEEGEMEDEIKVIARMDRKKKIWLFHVLLDEQKTFSAWLRDQIDVHLVEKEPKRKMKPRKGGVKDAR